MHLGTVLNKHKDMEEVRESCEKYKCHGVSSKGYGREECFRVGKERLEE